MREVLQYSCWCLGMFFVTDALGQDIFRSTCQGKTERIDSLLVNEQINVQDSRGRSLLHWAVACRQQEAFNFLVDQQIDIDLQDHEGATPLHIAVQLDRPAFFDQLVALYSNTEWVDKFGASLMEQAVLKRSQAYVLKLLENGVDVDAINGRGSTPLEIADRSGAEDIKALLLVHGADSTLIRSFKFEGAYLGQESPGVIPKLFAANVISTEESEFGSVFNKAGTEFYFGVDVNGKTEIRFSYLEDNVWSQPLTILSHERYGYNDPFLSPDENRLYFISERALDGVGEMKDHDIWYVNRTAGTWSEPINAGPNINSDHNEYYISFTKEGTMYFASNVHADQDNQADYDIYSSQVDENGFLPPKRLGEAVNTSAYEADVFVDPEEEYLIFCATRSEGLGRGDLYISFRNDDGGWTEAVNMGSPVNTHHHELCPFVTADGKYLFYTSNQDIYWVSTEYFKMLKD